MGGLSLEQIGALANRDPSTVGYWVRKHGLTANGATKHAPRGRLGREQLEVLVQRGLTLAEMAEYLDRSISAVRYWLAVSRKGATLGIRTLRAEAAKCVVLCANCHAEVEGGVATLPIK